MPDWLKNRLVEDASNVFKWWSTRLNALLAIVLGVFASSPFLPAQISALFPDPAMQVKIAGVWVLFNMIARVIKQPNLPK